MECIICSEVTRQEERLVCSKCLKPTCCQCFLEIDKCPNCRESKFYPLKIKNYRALTDMINRHINPLCTINGLSGLCDNNEVMDLVDDGASGNKVFSCTLHSFTCIECGQRYSKYGMRVCHDCLIVHCYICAKARSSMKILCNKCNNKRILNGFYLATPLSDQPPINHQQSD